MIINNTKSVLKYIKSVMTMNGIQNKDLANSLCISESALSARFKQENISINVLLEIIDALDLVMDVTFINKEQINKHNSDEFERLSVYHSKITELQNNNDA